MDPAKKARLEAKGWKVGAIAELLGMSPEEEALMEIRYAWRQAIRARREALNLTQATLAKRLKTSQPRVAMIESADPSVSLDQMASASFALGIRHSQLLRILADTLDKKDGIEVDNQVIEEPEKIAVTT